MLQETPTHFRLLDDRELAEELWSARAIVREAALWAVLDEEQREEAIARIRALRSFEAEGNWATRAKEAGLSRPRFFSMLREWRARPSIASVLPQALGRVGRTAGASADENVREHARGLLKLHPDSTKEQLLVSLRGALSDGNGRSDALLRRVLEDERANLMRSGLGGMAGFGRHVLLDATPMTVRARAGEPGFSAMAGLVVDAATTVVLGRAVGGGTDDADACMWAAASAAAAAVPGLNLPVTADEEPSFEIVLGGDPVKIMRQHARLAATPVRADVRTDRRARPRGARLLELLGPGLGHLDFRPRLTLPEPARTPGPAFSIDAEAPPSAVEIVDVLLEGAIERHNARVLAGGAAAPVPPGRVADGLRALAPKGG